MSSLNKVLLIGRVGKDPEIRTMQSGDRVANFSLATSETWKTREGERKEKTTWHNVVCFNDGLVKVIEGYVRKGSQLYLEGAIQVREYTDKDGAKRTATEIVLQKFRGELVLLGGKSDSGGEERSAPAEKSASAPAYDFADDIPF